MTVGVCVCVYVCEDRRGGGGGSQEVLGSEGGARDADGDTRKAFNDLIETVDCAL